MADKSVTISSRNFEGSIVKSWTCDFVERSGSLLVFRGEFDSEINHEHLGLIERGTISYEYYWLDRWYNVFRFHEPDGTFRNYYCNICMPPTFEDSVLDYVDLDIDILVAKDGSHSILDAEEFEINAERYCFSDDLRAEISNAVSELTEMIETRQFPFDHGFLSE